MRSFPGMFSNRSLVPAAALLACVCGALPACYVEPEPVTVSSGVYAGDGYEPAYYDGYLVYYDSVGRPFYYNRGAVVWVSPGSPYYGGLVNHYRLYGPAYHRWYGHYGYGYRGYRVAPGYHAYHGYGGGYRGGHRR